MLFHRKSSRVTFTVCSLEHIMNIPSRESTAKNLYQCYLLKRHSRSPLPQLSSRPPSLFFRSTAYIAFAAAPPSACQRPPVRASRWRGAQCPTPWPGVCQGGRADPERAPAGAGWQGVGRRGQVGLLKRGFIFPILPWSRAFLPCTLVSSWYRR
jgi:hypothetical protein